MSADPLLPLRIGPLVSCMLLPRMQAGAPPAKNTKNFRVFRFPLGCGGMLQPSKGKTAVQSIARTDYKGGR